MKKLLLLLLTLSLAMSVSGVPESISHLLSQIKEKVRGVYASISENKNIQEKYSQYGDKAKKYVETSKNKLKEKIGKLNEHLSPKINKLKEKLEEKKKQLKASTTHKKETSEKEKELEDQEYAEELRRLLKNYLDKINTPEEKPEEEEALAPISEEVVPQEDL